MITLEREQAIEMLRTEGSKLVDSAMTDAELKSLYWETFFERLSLTTSCVP